MDRKKQWEELERATGYIFQDPSLLERAMTHSSYINEHHMLKTDCNERLEFLGDAVLEIVTSEYLYFHYPTENEGRLTRLRASIVCEPTLDFCARAFDLQRFLILGRGEEATGGRSRASLISDALEALIGAIYLDGGFANAKEFIHRFILNDLEHKKLFFDSKTIMQEMVQKEDGSGHLAYELIEESGPAHDRLFLVRVLFDGGEMGRGSGHTKKAAEQQAAYQAILCLRKKQGLDQTCI